MTKIPVTIMRGGTSKGAFFNEQAMPKQRKDWEEFLLDVMGSPDNMQIDGLGGANSLTSKVAIIKKSKEADVDIDYTFAQVSIDKKMVDFKGNCGNISSAVGPYAIEQGLVAAREPVTEVRIYNTNTKKVIISEVEVEDGRVKQVGNCSIPGVPGTGSPIYLSFKDAEGSVTGKVFPTGNAIDLIETSFGAFCISIVDVANPLVFVKAADMGLDGTEMPDDYTPESLAKLEEVRSIAAELCRFCPKEGATENSPAVPKLTIVAEPIDYIDLTGRERKAEDMDLVIRMMSMQRPHRALAITGAVCTAAAAYLENTIVSRMVQNRTSTLRLAHPAGIMETQAQLYEKKVHAIKVVRTSRRIMEGYVYTKKEYEMAGSTNKQKREQLVF
ncbi:2-methylaconitate cis-trans isomerase PrpF family protein [Fictibacillus sp. KU28468]|uniref:2-methylaconitate cis-trans isomerase PrpF family protein n=1 Tax=Fictibacillus sp. KU28468 TaxID=2991053 RepID=UPI00223E39B7|nr:PrpF domain-containing protein [Fictibacillus sp. KU28468]UZJ77075.1 3-methylitaconate isomerase [Fictibacillus sp. KU28468]